jgi:Lipid A core - O-antigen ligase and related enzymes
MSGFPPSPRAPRLTPSLQPSASSERVLPSIRPAVIVAAALLLAIIAGHFLAGGRLTLGLAVVLGVCYAPLVLLDLTMALAVFVAVLFVQDVSAFSVGPNTIGVLVLLGWLGTFVTRSSRRIVLREQSRLLQLLGLFGLWLTLSLIWADNASDTAEGLKNWLIAILPFVLVMTALHRPRDVTAIGIAFIVGAVASVTIGIASGALSAAESSINETAVSGRFTGGGGDPNVQAAGYLIALFLCAGFWGIARRRLARVALLVAFVVVAIGFFATQSRGGLIALAVASIAGLVISPRQRKRLLALTAAAGVGLGIVALVNPAAIARMTDIGGGTSGRNDLWKVAWTIFNRHHWIGIGLNNFQAVEPHYALKSGQLKRVDLIVEAPHLVHNLYLQLLTETGVIGFAIFLMLIAACMHATWLAARRFDAVARVDFGDLARAVLMAEIAMLATQFFISDGDDPRLWILLGLGPVLLALARHVKPRDAALAPPLGLRRPAHRLARSRTQRKPRLRASSSR